MKYRGINLYKIMLITLSLLVILPLSIQSKEKENFKAPLNAPAQIIWNGKTIQLIYNHQTIFKAEITNIKEQTTFNKIVDNNDDKINQVLKWASRKNVLKLVGHIYASEESFPCESDRKREGPDVVRHSVGLSQSLLNRAVYERKFDWVLSVDFPFQVEIIPEKSTSDSNVFKIIITGRDIIIRFRPYFYQKHRGLTYFQPWTYQVWKKPVSGWCSWFAYFKEVTEDKIKHTPDVISEVLAPYGYEYLQIGDSYQQPNAGLPETWLNPNNKFPSGLKSLSEYISRKGLQPGIWTYTSFHQKEYAESNKQYFVLDDKGNPAYGNWVGYVMDGSYPETIDKIIRQFYCGFKSTGWKYFKVDALRHLRYEGYNSYSQYFKDKKLDRVKVYRNFVKAIREEIGEENFMLGCWGIRPGLAGIIDGCRIGGDGFGYAGLAQYNSFNNVVWRNNPDLIELSPEEAYRSCMVTSLTGSLFMLTDQLEVYLTEIVEPAKRSVPVLFTLPGQIYDIDPSRSSQLYLVESELSGDEIRFFDSDRTPRCHLFLLEINKPYKNWMLLGRTGGDLERIQVKHLGLNDEKEYLVFEFWQKKLIGSIVGEFSICEINPKYDCQLFCNRERKPHPQILATNRHITGGGFDLKNVIWQENTLAGESGIVGNDTYTLYLTEPSDYKMNEFKCEGAEILALKRGV